MNFLGMGPMEVIIVLLVAFIFLGPERMVDTARMLGKATRELRRMAAELPRLDLDPDNIIPSSPQPARNTSAATRPGVDATESEAPEPDEEEPVAFGRSAPAATNDDGGAGAAGEQR